MYTVLIMSKNAMECMHQFYPLLSKDIDEGKIGICQWMESGTTVDTAVPELYDLTCNKRAWKAIVVGTEVNESSDKYPADPINPYDFYEDESHKGPVAEGESIVDCCAPLIRLTHMLSGAPIPDPEFEAVIVESENKAPRVEYHPAFSEELIEARRACTEWNEKNTFKGLPPDEIILIKARKNEAANDASLSAYLSWQVHTEAESSEFWKRNLYPSCCRFLLFNISGHGDLRQSSDLFRLWVGVVLISRNNIDPNVLQAHRLYVLNVILDSKLLSESFQKTVSCLNTAIYRLNKRIDEETSESMEEDDGNLHYKIHVPVLIQSEKTAKLKHNIEQDLSKEVGAYDIAGWEDYTKSTKEAIKTLAKLSNRTFNQAADGIRKKCRYTEDEVCGITHYQEEDIKESMGETYEEILQQQRELPLSEIEFDENIEGAGKRVRNAMIGSITEQQASFATVVSVIISACFMIPALLYNTSAAGFAAIAVSTVLLIMAGKTVMLLQKSRINGLIKNFRTVFFETVSKITGNSPAYSNFLSSIASYMHGSSYLAVWHKKKSEYGSSYYAEKRYIESAKALLAKISRWSLALHAKVDMNVTDLQSEEIFIERDGFDSVYSLGTDKMTNIPINKIGTYIESPFEFVERLEIEREEAYDNND